MDSLVFGCPMLIRKCIHKNSCKDSISVFNTSKSLFNIFNGKIDIDKIDIHKSEINYEELEKYLIHKKN